MTEIRSKQVAGQRRKELPLPRLSVDVKSRISEKRGCMSWALKDE